MISQPQTRSVGFTTHRLLSDRLWLRVDPPCPALWARRPDLATPHASGLERGVRFRSTTLRALTPRTELLAFGRRERTPLVGVSPNAPSPPWPTEPVDQV